MNSFALLVIDKSRYECDIIFITQSWDGAKVVSNKINIMQVAGIN